MLKNAMWTVRRHFTFTDLNSTLSSANFCCQVSKNVSKSKQSNYIWLFVKIDVKIPHPRKSYPLWISISSLLLNFTLQHITTGKDKVIYSCKNRNNPICLQMKWFFVFLFFSKSNYADSRKREKHAAFIIQSKSLWTADYSWILKWRA